MSIEESESLRVYNLLEDISIIHNDSDLGKIAQIFLGFIFYQLGFKITNFQLSGEPDFKATRNEYGFCIEVKSTKSNNISINEKILQSISNSGLEPIVVVLFLSSTETRWFVIDGKKMKSGTYNKSILSRYSVKDIENKINQLLLATVEKYYNFAEAGVDSLYREFKSVTKCF